MQKFLLILILISNLNFFMFAKNLASHFHLCFSATCKSKQEGGRERERKREILKDEKESERKKKICGRQ
jgi:hypothetical protein